MTHEDENVGRATIAHRTLVIASIVGMVCSSACTLRPIPACIAGA